MIPASRRTTGKEFTDVPESRRGQKKKPFCKQRLNCVYTRIRIVHTRGGSRLRVFGEFVRISTKRRYVFGTSVLRISQSVRGSVSHNAFTYDCIFNELDLLLFKKFNNKKNAIIYTKTKLYTTNRKNSGVLTTVNVFAPRMKHW